MELLSYGSLPVLTANTKLEWKWLTVANTLAYHNTAIITAVKGFILQVPVKNRVEFSTLDVGVCLMCHNNSLAVKRPNLRPIYIADK